MTMTNENNLLSREYVSNFSIVLEEQCDINKLEIIINMYYDLPEIGCLRDVSKGAYTKTDKDGTLTLLKSMYDNKLKTNKVTYKFATYCCNARLFAKEMSAQNCNRNVRNTVYGEYYYDIDMVAAHINICIWYCNYEGIVCNHLQYYLENREQCILEMMTIYNIDKDMCKEAILTVLNGGNPMLDREIAPEWLKQLTNQMTMILKSIVEKNPDEEKKLKKKLKRNKEVEFNINGKVANKIFCIIENNLLMIIKNYIVEIAHQKVGALIFDGLMIEKGTMTIEDVDELINKIEVYVKDKTTFNLKLTRKSMDNVIDLSVVKDKFIQKQLRDQLEKETKKQREAREKIEKKTIKNKEQLASNMSVADDDIDLFNFNSYNRYVNKLSPYVDINELFINTIFEIQGNCKNQSFTTVSRKFIDDEWVESINTDIKGIFKPDSPLYKSTILKNNKSLAKYWGKYYTEDDEYIKVPLSNILYQLYTCNYLSQYNGYCFKPFYGPRLNETENLTNDKLMDFNLFRGFSMWENNPYIDFDKSVIREKFEASPMYHLMTYVLCNNNDKLIEYYLNYISHIFQKPNDNSDVLMTFVSAEGCGKDTVHTDFVGKMLGHNHFIEFQNSELIFTNFNSEQEGVLLTVLNELSDGANKDSAMFKKHNQMKGLLTAKEIRIEKKGMEPYRTPQRSRYIAHTQYKNSVSIEHSDRRNLLIECNEEYKNDPVYFKPIFEWLDNKENIKLGFAYFNYRNIKGFNPRIIPLTEAKIEQKIHCASNSFTFLRSFWSHFDLTLQGPFEIPKKVMFKLFMNYCKEANNNTIKDTTFNKQLKAYNIPETKACKTLNVKNANDLELMKLYNKQGIEYTNKRAVGYVIDKPIIKQLLATYLNHPDLELDGGGDDIDVDVVDKEEKIEEYYYIQKTT